MKSLVWFRSDIRMDDNPALREACANYSEVHAIYLYSPKQLNAHNESNVKIDFLIQNLTILNNNLNKFNIPLTVLESDGFDNDSLLIKDISIERQIDKVFWNNQIGEDEQARDRKTIEFLSKINIEHESFFDQVVYEPGTLKTGQGGPYSVFTPFKRKWIENFDMDFLDINFKYEVKKPSKISSNIESFNFQFIQNHTVDMNQWRPGEDEAAARLNNFLKNKIIDYSKNRNDPIIDGTSRISPYLALGIISSKRCILEALKLNNFEFNSGHIGITKWIDEIVWREFYKNIMFCFPKVSKGQPFQDYSKLIKWRYVESEFNAWKKGITGFPIVDAAMRQLQNEGWMHNRLRMVVAMFFTKNMLHDWRLGEAYFMQNLIDGDFASNNGGWQWSSSTGTDAAPYFRIFNPITQSTNFDKEGLFIKKYIPELKDLDKSVIHNPPKEHRKYCKYPEPILDLKESRLRAIAAFKESKS
jgi:deoxyribodipyrimidine photo-lyase